MMFEKKLLVKDLMGDLEEGSRREEFLKKKEQPSLDTWNDNLITINPELTPLQQLQRSQFTNPHTHTMNPQVSTTIFNQGQSIGTSNSTFASSSYLANTFSNITL